MNDQLKRGATDGLVRNMRPDSAGADYSHARGRAEYLHPQHFGTFGHDRDAMTPFTEKMLPDDEIRSVMQHRVD
jgi:hypothetical protein